MLEESPLSNSWPIMILLKERDTSKSMTFNVASGISAQRMQSAYTEIIYQGRSYNVTETPEDIDKLTHKAVEELSNILGYEKQPLPPEQKPVRVELNLFKEESCTGISILLSDGYVTLDTNDNGTKLTYTDSEGERNHVYVKEKGVEINALVEQERQRVFREYKVG